MGESEQRISIDQVRVGLYIRLEDWMDHPFLFSSFKVRNEKQLRILRSLGAKSVIYVPSKSDTTPLPPSVPELPDDIEPEKEGDTEADLLNKAQRDAVTEAAKLVKAERHVRALKQRESVLHNEKRFAAGVSKVKSMMRNLFARPHESVQFAQELVSEIVDTLLEDKDVVLHLMNAKSGDENAYYHALNVTMLSLILGREAQMTPTELRALGLGTLLHDIGKEKIPSQILLKRSPWTTAERNFYQQHVLYGVEMVQQLPNIPAGALEVVALHHEFLNGAGFPGKLKDERIGRFARIACIANTFDNYCNRINPADSMTPAEALSHMFKREKEKYDVELMQLFVQRMGVYPPGSLVQLSNGMIGLVMSVTPGQLLYPSLVIYDPDVPKEEPLWLDLTEEPDLSITTVLRPGDLPKEVFNYLEPRSRVSYYAVNNTTPKRTQ